MDATAPHTATPHITAGLPRVLTVQQAAEAMQVDHKTVRRRIADGTLPCVRIGGCIRVPVAAVQKMLTPA